MENRNELSDIVLERGDNKTQKMKRILILVAFLILVFLIALASMKLMNKDQSKDTSKLILPPEPTQETQIPKDDQLFKQVPIIEENPKKENFEDMIKTLKDKETQKQENAKAADVQSNNANDTATVTQSTPEPATSNATSSTTKPKVETKKDVAKPMMKSTPETSTHGSNASAGIYVQVGAVTTTPRASDLSHIKDKGFEYKLYSTVVNGSNVTKILIGPYAKSSEAQEALVSIRSSINKNAFIYRVK